MYRSRFWTMRQYAGFATAEETNRRFRYLLEQGQTGLSVAFDLPTQMGYDSDAPEAEGEVGRVGVPISSLADMEVLLDGLPLGEVSTSMTINATAPILLALYVAAAESAGRARDRISGTTQNDILKEYIARGTWIYPPRPSMRLVTDIFEFCAAELPRWNTISISRLPHARGGGDRRPGAGVHAGRRDRVRARRPSRGASTIDDFAGRAVASSSPPGRSCSRRSPSSGRPAGCGPRIMQERFGAIERAFDGVPVPRPDRRLVADRPVDRQQRRPDDGPGPAAVLGGAQSLHTNSRDEALALPTEEAPGSRSGPSRSSPTRAA